MSEIERWKPVVGWEGAYEVSDQGRVRSLARRDASGHLRRARMLTANLHKSTGRYRVTLTRCGKTYTRYIHRLVLEAFVGPCPPGMEACHWDDNPENNALTNLRWDTSTANKRDCVRNGHNVNASKTHCPQGHPYDEANTYLHRGVYRHCRICRKAQDLALKARRRSLEAA